MHGFCGILGLESDLKDKDAFVKSINLTDTMHVDTLSEGDFFSAVSFLNSSPVKGTRIYKTDDLIILFAGDLIEYEKVPWQGIETNIIESNFEWFSTLRGLFAFVIYDIKLNQITLISDQCAQFPVYYGYMENSFVFSTDLSTFTTLEEVPAFNEEWLYEYMFFNFPIDRTTFLKGVKRLRPISVLKFNHKSKLFEESQYGEYFKKAENILTGKDSIDVNIKAFKDRIPRYFSKDKVTLAAISGGFDSRTLLAMAPENAKVETYTYGVEGSADLETVSTFIDKLKLKHKEILFDDDFKKLLPNLIYDTVRLSGGIQPILRSTLLYAYNNLFKNDGDIPIVMGGISGDLYRGWDFQGPSILSKGMSHYYQTGEAKTDNEIYRKMFGSEFNSYQGYIRKELKKIKKFYGNPKKAEARMLFNVYQTSPNYFGGEMAIASNFFTFRQPFWDIDLIKLAFRTDCSYIGYLKRLKENKDTKYKQYVLQTKVIVSNPKFKKTNIRGLPIALFTYGNISLLKMSRLIIRGVAFLKGYRAPENDLEEWEDWFGKTLHSEFDKLLNDKSLILEYINKDILDLAKKTNDIHLLSKLTTTEIILNLIKNRWDMK